MTEKKLTDTFQAVDAAGNTYIIQVWKTLPSYTSGGVRHTVEGTRELRTDDGDSVNRNSVGDYTIFSGIQEIHVTSDDPNAV